jgi:hypothetical protein
MSLMRSFRFRFGVPLVAAVLVAVWLGAGLVSAQGPEVRINAAIDKLAKGKSLAGAIMYDFSLYAAAQFSSSDLDFMIIDMEHRGLDFRAPRDVPARDDQQGRDRQAGQPAGARASDRAYPDLRPRAERSDRETGARHGRVRHHVSGDREQAAGARGRVRLRAIRS